MCCVLESKHADSLQVDSPGPHLFSYAMLQYSIHSMLSTHHWCGCVMSIRDGASISDVWLRVDTCIVTVLVVVCYMWECPDWHVCTATDDSLSFNPSPVTEQHTYLKLSMHSFDNTTATLLMWLYQCTAEHTL